MASGAENPRGSAGSDGAARAGAASVKRPGLRAAAGLLLSLVSPFAWVATFGVPFLHRTGLAMWACLAAGLWLTAGAVRGSPRRWPRVALGLQLALIAMLAWGQLGASRLPESDAATLERAPDFELPDPSGRPVRLSDELRRGPVLLVFYRGHW
jgi:hypothetical protein